MSVSERKFGILQTGETVKIFHLENKSGAYAEVTDFGAILVKVCVPDKDGTLTDVVLGYDDLASYEVNGCFFGSTIGRNGNRIGGAKFSVNGKEVVLAQNVSQVPDFPFMDRNTSLTRMRMTIIFTAVLTDLKKSSGKWLRFPMIKTVLYLTV